MKAATIAVLVLLAGGTAVAGINTDNPPGPMNLYIGGVGRGTIINDSDEPFNFDGSLVVNGVNFRRIRVLWRGCTLKRSEIARVLRRFCPGLRKSMHIRSLRRFRLAGGGRTASKARAAIAFVARRA
ncbi:MAG: hypothetical protein ACOC95_08445 [Planctomycetota bacterium]